MNLKKEIIIALAATALFASFGCGGGGKQSASGTSAGVSTQQKKPLDEATIKEIGQKMTSPNIEDKKAVCPIEKLPLHIFLKTSLRDEATFNMSQSFKFENPSVSNIKETGDFATANVSYTGVDNKQFNEKWYFKRIDGKWVYNLGIKTAKSLKVSGYDEAALEAAANIGYGYDNEPNLALDVRSKTTTVYQLGGWSHPAYILITDQGEFPVQNTDLFSAPTGVFRITSAQPFRLYLPFRGATGTPKALRITGFNELDGRGFAVGHDSSQVVTFTFSE